MATPRPRGADCLRWARCSSRSSGPHYGAGWISGPHDGPLMPCALGESPNRAFDGPPREVGMSFQVADGRLVGPRDMRGDVFV
jgi:fructose 1,6-bisphosphatase